MKHKRSLTGHQRQIWFFTIFFCALMIIVLVALMWLMNRTNVANN